MYDNEQVGIFWDYENCRPPSTALGHGIVNRTLDIAHQYGSITTFKAYLDLNESASSKTSGIYSELQSSGVSVIHCPHNGRKDVADKMIIVDMLAYGIDRPPPATIILISGDRDFSYAVSVLRLRKYRVIVITPAGNGHESLKYLASDVIDWSCIVSEAGATHSRNISSSGQFQPYSKARRESLSTKPQVPIDIVAAPKSEAVHDPSVDGIATALLSNTPLPDISRRTSSTVCDSTSVLSGSLSCQMQNSLRENLDPQSSPTSSTQPSPPHTPCSDHAPPLAVNEYLTPPCDHERELPLELLERMGSFELDLLRASPRVFTRPYSDTHVSVPARPRSCVDPILTEERWVANKSPYNIHEHCMAREPGLSLAENENTRVQNYLISAPSTEISTSAEAVNTVNAPLQQPAGLVTKTESPAHPRSSPGEITLDNNLNASDSAAIAVEDTGESNESKLDSPYRTFSPPAKYVKLIRILEELRMDGIQRPLLSTVAQAMAGDADAIFRLSGAGSFAAYANIAQAEGIIELGPSELGLGAGWMSLRPSQYWYPGRVFLAHPRAVNLARIHESQVFQRYTKEDSRYQLPQSRSDAVIDTRMSSSGFGCGKKPRITIDSEVAIVVDGCTSFLTAPESPVLNDVSTPSEALLNTKEKTAELPPTTSHMAIGAVNRKQDLIANPGNLAPSPSNEFKPAVQITVSNKIPKISSDFEPLIKALEEFRLKGCMRPRWTEVALSITDRHLLFERMGVNKFKDYLILAEKAGIIQLGTAGSGMEWMSLCAMPRRPSAMASPETASASGPPGYERLVSILESLRKQGIVRPLFSSVAEAMGQDRDLIYRRKGVNRFADYVEVARQAGIVDVGKPGGGREWISLRLT